VINTLQLATRKNLIQMSFRTAENIEEVQQRIAETEINPSGD
jgi:hypothetical protein